MVLDVAESRGPTSGPADPPHPPRPTGPRDVVGWIVVVTLAVGAACIGLRPTSILWPAIALVGLAFAVWLPDAIHRRALGKPTSTVLALGGALVAYGLIGLWNVRAAFDPARGKVVPRPHVEWLPGAADAGNALPDLASASAGLAVLAICMDLGRSARWRRRLLASLAFGGLLTATIGLLAKTPILSTLPAILRTSRWSDGQPFGLLLSHGTAGTMMAMSIPALAALGLRDRLRHRALATAGILLVATATTANISRTGLALAGLLAPVSLIILWVGHAPGRQARAWLAPLAGAASAMLLLAGFLIVAQPTVATRLDGMGERWSSWYPRYLQAKGALELIHREPLFGHGPGGYRMLISESSIGHTYLAPKYVPETPFTLLLTASNDYLQALVEWGFTGCVLWAALMIGGAARLGRAIVRPPGRVCRREAALVALAIFAIFAHAVVDCPLQVPSLQWAAAGLLGMAWSAPRWRGAPTDVLSDFLR